MKKIFTAVCLLFVPLVMTAQVVVENARVGKNKRNIDISFDIDTDNEALKSRYKMVLTPYLYSGADTVLLAPVEIYGNIRYKRERQEQALGGNGEWTLGEGQMRKGGVYSYSASIPYVSEFRTASLGLSREIVGCGCECYDGEQLLWNGLVYVTPEPVVEDTPELAVNYEVVDAHRRWVFDSEEMKVFFTVSRTDLNPAAYGNQATLDEIMEAIRKIGDLDKIRLSGIEITGFASPEGGLAFNTRLGKGRAEALREYIRSQEPGLTDEDFNLINGVENWEGLRRLVAASDMEYRDEVLEIIDTRTGEDRKNALKALDGWRPYSYMLRTFYPQLRNACYVSVYYDVLGDVAADAVNAANAMIREKRYADALDALLEYRDDERAWNSIGVCYMMLEDEDEAAVWFGKALGAGDETARRNLEQIR